ncbi:furin-like protease kpc-1 [Mytilus trossulus]|uniref:furin-like protease kpc-1 n=1 Tax=Mytilus trossulus TaxID=6551 RepID=UPI003004BCB3
MKCKQFIGVVVIWVSKYLWFTECATCNIRIDNPELNRLWYLHSRNGYDMNVLQAWRSCINGTGVTVGVIDKGVQDHIDLNINRNLDAGKTQSEEYWSEQLILEQNRQNQQRWRSSYNRQYQQRWRSGYNRQPHQRWNSGYNIQHKKQESLKHGTRVAGIVAAKKNGLGIVGIAFGAEIADITIASSAVLESFNASSLRHRSDVIDVYSWSLANFNNGTKTYPLLPNQRSALEYGTTYGRRGLGSVYVFATGNNGGEEADVFRESCSYDRLVTNRYVISVAGIQHNLQKLPNGEACSAMMVAAFTAKAGGRSYKVITTDIGNRTTVDFTQTSAAASMVSGAVALALSANPALTYRDIMHLLVQTSRSNLPDNIYRSKFFTNAANIKVSSYFGFGLLDIGKLVAKSKTWYSVPSRQNCRSTTTYNKRLNRDSIEVQVTQCSVTYIEHVEVSLKVNHQYAGQIKWVLVSPHGTKSTILPGRGLDPTTNMDITVLTVQMWGENPIGYWTLEPTAVFGKSLGYGTVESASLLVHGYACRSSVDECLPPSEQDRPSPAVRSLPEQVDRTQAVASSLMTDQEFWTNWGQWSSCSVTCGQATQSRRRQCHSGSCSGVRLETRRCSDLECQNEVHYNGRRSGVCPPQNELTTRCMEQCSYDSDCSVNQKCCFNGCGKTCEMSRAYQGSWTNWNQWSICSVTCGRGTRSRRRQCHSGHCSGERSETGQCNNHECQTEVQYNGMLGEWSQWSQWSRCSSTSGYGTRDRRRQCAGTCHGNRRESKDCFTPCLPHSCCDTYASCSDYVRRHQCRTTDYVITVHCQKTCGLC